MKRLPARDFLVAQASNASPARTLWSDRAPCPVIATNSTGKVAVLPENGLARLASLVANP